MTEFIIGIIVCIVSTLAGLVMYDAIDYNSKVQHWFDLYFSRVPTKKTTEIALVLADRQLMLEGQRRVLRHTILEHYRLHQFKL